MGCKPGAQRRNSRNECIRLRELLIKACKALERYPNLMPPELHLWWICQKPLPPKANQAELDMAAISELLAKNSDLAESADWIGGGKW